MPNIRPYVANACLCEKVIVEPDQVASLIRIVDTYTMRQQAPLPEGYRAALDLTIFINLKSGDVTGEHEVGLLLRKPNGEETAPPQKWPVVFRGGEHGITLNIEFKLAGEPGVLPTLGLYWFEVLWGDDEVLTRIPLKLKQAEPTAAPASPTS